MQSIHHQYGNPRVVLRQGIQRNHLKLLSLDDSPNRNKSSDTYNQPSSLPIPPTVTFAPVSFQLLAFHVAASKWHFALATLRYTTLAIVFCLLFCIVCLTQVGDCDECACLPPGLRETKSSQMSRAITADFLARCNYFVVHRQISPDIKSSIGENKSDGLNTKKNYRATSAITTKAIGAARRRRRHPHRRQ